MGTSVASPDTTFVKRAACVGSIAYRRSGAGHGTRISLAATSAFQSLFQEAGAVLKLGLF